MKSLLAFAHGIDWLTDRFGKLAAWAVILSCFISAGNAVVRYAFDISSNGFLEIQWYLFAACVMLGAAQVLRVNEHVRVDLIYARLSGRGKVYVDLFGLVFFLVPVMLTMIWFA
ncbi:MAG: TRAP transporter small permease subunit, partial [Burkholderiaceae bacterium]